MGLYRRLLGRSPRALLPAEIDGSSPVAERTKAFAETFLLGYNAALDTQSPNVLAGELSRVPLDLRGIAFEGAGMGLTILDRILPGPAHRFGDFLAGPGKPHAFIMHVGAGVSFSVLPFGLDRFMKRLDPVARWSVPDGYGFFSGYRNWARYRSGWLPRNVRGYVARGFDQGLGRGLWFICSGDVSRIAHEIEQLPLDRRGDLWSGIGLASTYAGGVDASTLSELLAAAKDNAADVQQGSAFAVYTRIRGENVTPAVAAASELYWGDSPESVAEVVQSCLEAARTATDEAPVYEVWRRLIRTRAQAKVRESEARENRAGNHAFAGGRL
jgi:hypothetical protein